MKLSTMFHMTNDADLFRSHEQLEADGWNLIGNAFYKEGDRYLPLYEGRLGHQFNHRFASQPNGRLFGIRQGFVPGRAICAAKISYVVHTIFMYHCSSRGMGTTASVPSTS